MKKQNDFHCPVLKVFLSSLYEAFSHPSIYKVCLIMNTPSAEAATEINFLERTIFLFHLYISVSF